MHLYRARRAAVPEDPARLPRLIAADAVRQVGQYTEFTGRVVLDVGARSGHLAEAIEQAGARFVGISFPGAATEPGDQNLPDAVIGAPTALPVHSGAVDICYSADVLQQVTDPEHMAGEMVRVTRPGGLVFLCFVPWYSPSGGLETAPWHYLGGNYAGQRYERAHGRPPQNRYGENLFEVSVSRMVHWARGRGDIASVQLVPRYFPSWVSWIVHVPGVRELAVRHVALILRVR
jgi:arabinofuranan 3-O-arabinosyltransferase